MKKIIILFMVFITLISTVFAGNFFPILGGAQEPSVDHYWWINESAGGLYDLNGYLSVNGSSIGSLNWANLDPATMPGNCTEGLYRIGADNNNGYCVAAMRTTGENVSGDYVFGGDVWFQGNVTIVSTDSYVVNGSTIWETITGTDTVIINASAGTATRPTIAFGDLTDTGLYESAADNLSIIAGAIEKIRASNYSVSNLFGNWSLENSNFLMGTTNNSEYQPMMGMNEDNLVEMPTGLQISGGITLTPDQSPIRWFNVPVTASSADGTEHSVSFAIDNNDVFKFGGLADGAGGADSFQVVISPGTNQNDSAVPSLGFGDGDTGFYESADDTIKLSLGGTERFSFNSATGFTTGAAGSAGIVIETPTATNPGFIFGGDLDTGIGTQGADNLSIIAGGIEQIRISENAWANQTIISPGGVQNVATHPSLAFGDGDTGFYESDDDTLITSLGGTNSWLWASAVFRPTLNGGFLMRESPSHLNPTIGPYMGDYETGIGYQGTDNLSIITNATEMIRVSRTDNENYQMIVSPGRIQNNITKPSLAFGDGDTGIYEASDDQLIIGVGSTGALQLQPDRIVVGASNSYPSLWREDPTATNPTITPQGGDPDTGIGLHADDNLSLIAGGIEQIRIVEDGYNQTIFNPGAIQNVAGTPTIAFGDGDTGLYEESDDTIYISVGGTARMRFLTVGISGVAAYSPMLINEGTSATNPTLLPSRTDVDTGIGADGTDDDNMSLIAGGWEGVRVSEDEQGLEDRIYIGLNGTTGVGGYITSNSTCIILHSPDGTGTSAVCNT